MHTSLDGLMHLAGSLAASSFIIIASGDFITSSIDKIVQKVLVPINHRRIKKSGFSISLDN
jgi:hypothetical protein